ncbi:MAG: sulfatase-like hydrolase/transferase [Akkermansiaceae bacterium]
MKQHLIPFFKALGLLITVSSAATKKPNVILIMTDDQGYGDLGCHGNSVLKTPHLDKMHAESVRLTDFHVSPFCTPTRAALMTGNHPAYTGAYRTSSGRTMMHPDEVTVAHLFADAGYATGMVGKWHLGDNAPHRPQDRGFQKAVWHRCGGIGQASDYWGNDYFDDTYERASSDNMQGTFEKFEGYCTDVWFRESLRFIENNKEKPFFLYLAPNAPHGPYFVPPEWAKPYQGNKDVPNANFYGMIANIDHNMGLLRKRLDELDLTENTILIFMTDNGTSSGAKFNGLDSEALSGFNAGMRGKKSSIYDGGHRVPFFIHWPKGGLTGGRDIDTLTAHIDILPTLAELCDIPVPKNDEPDGLSLKPLLDGSNDPWPRKHHFVQFHGAAGGNALPPQPFAHSTILTESWRLVNMAKEELYDIQADPAQREDVSSKHPEVVKQLREAYQPFWNKVSPRMTPVRIDLGNPAQNPTGLCSQDWHLEKGNPPWWFGSIKKLPRVTGPWMVEVKQPGRYLFTLRQWPTVAGKPLVAVQAKVAIAGQKKEMAVPSGCKAVRMELKLPAGPSELWTYLYDESGKAGGAYFTDVELVDDDGSPLRTEVVALAAPAANDPPALPRKPGNYHIGQKTTVTFNTRLDTLKNPMGLEDWKSGRPGLNDGSRLADLDFTALGITSWSLSSFGDSAKTVWDGAKLNGLTLNFSGHNFGRNDSMKEVNFSESTINTKGNQAFLFVDLTGADFSGATLNIAGIAKRMTAFREAKLPGADFSAITWGVPTKGLTEKTEFFFSGGPGSTSTSDEHLAVTFEGADLSKITWAAKSAMIKNLGKFDGKTAIGAKYNKTTLSKSGWTAKELDAAGWQRISER